MSSRLRRKQTKRKAPVKTFFHRTTEAAATAIIRNGFKDARGKYMTATDHQGVWLSDTPLDSNEGAEGDVLIAVDIDPAIVEKHEWIEVGKPYREYLVPAKWLKSHASIRRATMEEEEL